MDDRPILVVEDDAAVRGLIVDCLRTEGHRCVAVADAESALEAVERASFAAALVDNHLPGLSGVELVRHLHQTHPQLPLMLVTGDTEVSARVDGLDAGAADYLIKPFEVDELLARLRAHLRHQEGWSAAIEEELHRRAAVVRALGGIEPGGGADGAARAVCDAVMASGEVEGVAVAWFTDGGSVQVLAAQGVLGGDVIHRHLAAASPWLSRVRGPSAPWLEPLGWGEELIACAPLLVGPAPAGVLALVAHDGDGVDPRVNQRALASAADFAPMAARLIELAMPSGAEGTGGPGGLGIRVHIDESEMSTAFQPVVDLHTGDVVGWEALARFADRVPPATRFAAAAAAGMGPELELLAVRHALEDARPLSADTFVAVNISARSVVECRKELKRLIRDAGRTVVLELTEHDPVGDYGELRAALDRTPALVAVDDAGAGFASLRHVLLLEPSFIKLDRSWVSGIQGDPARQALVAGIAHLSRVTGAGLVAEGIETEDERRCVAELGAGLGQGYLLGAPAPCATAARRHEQR
jgi:EAL domain-containing protein (putative c-di-GMP-specific phosphodiesterase class I)/CheY-like chemotaxis protein